MSEDKYEPDPRSVMLVNRLAAEFPNARQILGEHTQVPGREVLPHMFFMDVADHVKQLYDRRQSPAAIAELRAILEFIEKAYVEGSDNHGSDREMIVVSFLEHLPDEFGPRAGLRDMLGPVLRHELDVSLNGPYHD